MKEFLSENWLAIIGALAWLPVLIKLCVDLFRKLHYVYLDRHIVHNSTTTFINNGVSATKNGMLSILSLNLFVYNVSYFPKSISCKITLNDNVKHTAKLYEGIIQYTDTVNFIDRYQYAFPDALNMNTNRTIFANTDNIRVLPFFFENLNMTNDENIKNIKITCKGRIFRKSFKIERTDCTTTNIISRYAVKIN